MTRPNRHLFEQPSDPADRIRFVLDDEHWQAFIDLLDRPERDMFKLAEFLSGPPILDDSENVAEVDASTLGKPSGRRW